MSEFKEYCVSQDSEKWLLTNELFDSKQLKLACNFCTRNRRPSINISISSSLFSSTKTRYFATIHFCFPTKSERDAKKMREKFIDTVCMELKVNVFFWMSDRAPELETIFVKLRWIPFCEFLRRSVRDLNIIIIIIITFFLFSDKKIQF